MKSNRFSRSGFSVAILSGFCVIGMARGDDHTSPMISMPKRIYPTGARITQSFEKPDANAAALVGPSAGPGHVSSLAAMNNLMSQPRTLSRVQKLMIPVFRSQTRVQLIPMNGPVNLTGVHPSLTKFSYGFHYKGVPLWKYSNQAQIVEVKDGSRRTLFFRERNMPNPTQIGETEATVKTDDATKAGLGDSKTETTAQLKVDDQGEPPHREIHVDGNGKATLAWVFVVRSTDRAQPYARRYWISARDEPTILAKEDLIYHAGPDGTVSPATHQGRITGNFFAFDKTPRDPAAENQGLNIFTAGVVGGHPVLTDINGFFNVSAGMTLNTHLVGPFCRVVNEAGGNLVATRTGNNLFFNAKTEQELAQVSAFKWVTTAHAFVADFLPAHADRLVGLKTHVNINDECNAFFDPGDHTLNFFKSSAQCVNSAYCDVACHEFGHAVDDQFGDILDGGYSEGFGDSIAVLITGDPVIGRDFTGPGTFLRDTSKVSTFPPPNPEVHEVGKIYGGFTWELIQQLTSKLGSKDKAFEAARHLVLGAAALNPKDTVNAVRLSFLVDSRSGSNFFDQLAAAADSRKIPRPASPGELDDPTSFAANSNP